MNKATWFVTAALSIAVSGTAKAGSATANLNISATVSSNCTISTSAVAFAYDPVVANSASGADVTGTGGVTVQCTKGDTHAVSLNFGQNVITTTQRRVKSGLNYLNYNLYTDNTYATLWGDGTSLTQTVSFGPFTSSATAITSTVFGKMLKGQDAPIGSYTDTVIATVNF